MSQYSLSFQDKLPGALSGKAAHKKAPLNGQKGQLNLPPAMNSHHHHGHHGAGGPLALPSQTIVDLRGLYNALFHYLALGGTRRVFATRSH